MKLYARNASTERRIPYGIDLMHRLGHFSETAVFAEEFAPFQERLVSSYQARQKADIALLKRRSDVAVRGLHIDRQVRDFARHARAVGGGAKSPLYRALFPEGLEDVVRPKGPGQLPLLTSLILRLSEHAAAEPVRRDWHAPLIELQEDFRGAVQALDKAEAAQREAFDRERVAREEHRIAVNRIDGGLQRLYAADRSMLKLFQPGRGLTTKRGPSPKAEAA